jgi:tight adherence protein C
MILILLVGLLLIAVSFGLFARALLLSRLRAAKALRQIDAYGFGATTDKLAPGRAKATLPSLHLKDAVDVVAGRFGTLLSRRVKNASEENLKLLLQGAGFYTLPPRRFIGYQVIGTLTLGALFLWFAVTGNRSPVVSLLIVIIAVLCGWSLPLTLVKRRARRRGERIDYDMPDLIDMLVATVEAGMAFSSSLQIAARRFRGPLGDELRLSLQEQSMGLGLNDALKNMLERQDTRAVRAFVRSLIQGEQLGVSVGQTLRNLSHDMRTLRRQLAEERAQKAPVKLVFPVVLLIFPALFVVTLGPAALRIHGIFQ